MQANIGAFDGWFRTLLFLLALCYAIMFSSTFGWIATGIGAILFGSAIIQWCPLYEMVGFSSNKK